MLVAMLVRWTLAIAIGIFTISAAETTPQPGQDTTLGFHPSAATESDHDDTVDARSIGIFAYSDQPLVKRLLREYFANRTLIPESIREETGFLTYSSIHRSPGDPRPHITVRYFTNREAFLRFYHDYDSAGWLGTSHVYVEDVEGLTELLESYESQHEGATRQRSQSYRPRWESRYIYNRSRSAPTLYQYVFPGECFPQAHHLQSREGFRPTPVGHRPTASQTSIKCITDWFSQNRILTNAQREEVGLTDQYFSQFPIKVLKEGLDKWIQETTRKMEDDKMIAFVDFSDGYAGDFEELFEDMEDTGVTSVLERPTTDNDSDWQQLHMK